MIPEVDIPDNVTPPPVVVQEANVMDPMAEEEEELYEDVEYIDDAYDEEGHDEEGADEEGADEEGADEEGQDEEGQDEEEIFYLQELDSDEEYDCDYVFVFTTVFQ